MRLMNEDIEDVKLTVYSALRQKALVGAILTLKVGELYVDLSLIKFLKILR